MKKNGINITENVNMPLFAYLGDTTTNVFSKNEILFQYPIIITECTILEEEDSQRASLGDIDDLRDSSPQ
jgi:ribonuclease Z